MEPKYEFLKTIDTRQSEYWNIGPATTYKLIKEMKLFNPDSLTSMFDKEMKRLWFAFQFHDLRRSFITNALRRKHYRDVQLTVGHKQIKTTERYAQDDRDFNRKRFVPH
jgi:integrase